MELLDAGIMADRTVSSITQVAQSTSYYCGPAALVSLVKADGDSISQATAAS
jgi:predicted double-glycine peptidase